VYKKKLGLLGPSLKLTFTSAEFGNKREKMLLINPPVPIGKFFELAAKQMLIIFVGVKAKHIECMLHRSDT
jgi:hypothetical protein